MRQARRGEAHVAKPSHVYRLGKVAQAIPANACLSESQTAPLATQLNLLMLRSGGAPCSRRKLKRLVPAARRDTDPDQRAIRIPAPEDRLIHSHTRLLAH